MIDSFIAPIIKVGKKITLSRLLGVRRKTHLYKVSASYREKYQIPNKKRKTNLKGV